MPENDLSTRCRTIKTDIADAIDQLTEISKAKDLPNDVLAQTQDLQSKIGDVQAYMLKVDYLARSEDCLPGAKKG